MQPGSFTSSDVVSLKSRVLVNGILRPHLSWSVDRELSGDLPAQVAATSGITQATGSVSWAESSDVDSATTNPWNDSSGWLPQSGDKVEIFAGNETDEWMQFTGIIDKTTGSIGGGFQSTIIDRYDDLSNPVSHDPLLYVMPPYTPGGTFRNAGLTYTYYVDLAMRAGRFFTTPGREVNSVLHVPCQGGMWPHYGELTISNTYSGATGPSNNFAPWGFSVGDFKQIYKPPAPRSLASAVQLTVLVAPTHNGFYYTQVNYGTSHVRMSISASWLVTAIVDGTTVFTFTLSGKGSDGPVLQLLAKNGTVTVKASNGQEMSGSVPFGGSTLMDAIRLDGDVNSRVAGLQVSHPETPDQEFIGTRFAPSATINTSDISFVGVPRAVPAMESKPGVDILQEISSAALAATWIDELGVLRWWPAIAVRGRTPSSTLTTLDDIFDLEWEDNFLGSRSNVTVKYEDTALKLSRWQNVELAVGSGETLSSEEVSEQFFSPESNVVWAGVDYVQENTGPGKWGLYNAKQGTLAGMYFTLNNDEITTEYPVSIGIQKLGRTGALKMTHTAGVFPANVEAVLSTSPTDPVLKSQNRDKPLPRIAGYARAEFLEQEYTSTVPGGVGPVLVHETGKWIPGNIVPRIADFIATETAAPKPSITGMGVAFNPRRQLGDVVRIESRKFLGVTVTALVTGVSNSASSSGFSQSLSVRIIDVDGSSMTYAEYDASLAGSNLTYTQWQALGPLPQTYSGFNDS